MLKEFSETSCFPDVIGYLVYVQFNSILLSSKLPELYKIPCKLSGHSYWKVRI